MLVPKRILAILIFLLMVAQAQIFAFEILYLSSGVIHLPWSDSILEGLKEGLGSSGLSYTLHEEYMSKGRFDAQEISELYLEYLSTKYERRSPDLCVLAGPLAAELLTENPGLFPDAPRICIEADVPEGPSVTVLHTDSDYTETIREMKNAAAPEHVYLIGDTANPADALRFSEITSELASAGIAHSALNDRSIDELLQEAAVLTEDSAIFYIPISRDHEGEHLIPFQVLQLLAEHTSAPIFSNTVTFVGHGTLGGYVTDPRLLGRAAAEVIEGTYDPGQGATGYGYYYDWELVKEYGFEKTIDKRSILLNRSPSFYESYTSEIYIAAFVTLLLIFLITTLGVLNGRLHHAKRHISNENIRLDKMVQERTKEIEELYHTAERLSRTDPLTGLHNRRSFFIEGHQIHDLSVRKHRPYSLLMIDIDHSKQVNDIYGHHTGDRVLAAAASAIQGQLRSSDLPARIGGEEFCVLLQEADCDHAYPVAERIREAVSSNPALHEGEPVRITVSIGISCRSDEGLSLEKVLSQADELMYAAKRSGRNRSCQSVFRDASVMGREDQN